MTKKEQREELLKKTRSLLNDVDSLIEKLTNHIIDGDKEMTPDLLAEFRTVLLACEDTVAESERLGIQLPDTATIFKRCWELPGMTQNMVR
jgi:predicted transcriptional regulator